MNLVERYLKAAGNVFRELDKPGTALHNEFWNSGAPVSPYAMTEFFGHAIGREAQRLKDAPNPAVN